MGETVRLTTEEKTSTTNAGAAQEKLKSISKQKRHCERGTSEAISLMNMRLLRYSFLIPSNNETKK